MAAIFALAIRVFFFQPFTIPTNSMWPTYSGMGAEFSDGAAPIHSRLLRGARHHGLVAPVAGEITVAVRSPEEARRSGNGLYYETVRQRRFGFWPVRRRRYFLAVGGVEVPLTVPEDFDMALLLLHRSSRKRRRGICWSSSRSGYGATMAAMSW